MEADVPLILRLLARSKAKFSMFAQSTKGITFTDNLLKLINELPKYDIHTDYRGYQSDSYIAKDDWGDYIKLEDVIELIKRLA